MKLDAAFVLLRFSHRRRDACLDDEASAFGGKYLASDQLSYGGFTGYSLQIVLILCTGVNGLKTFGKSRPFFSILS